MWPIGWAQRANRVVAEDEGREEEERRAAPVADGAAGGRVEGHDAEAVGRGDAGRGCGLGQGVPEAAGEHIRLPHEDDVACPQCGLHRAVLHDVEGDKRVGDVDAEGHEGEEGPAGPPEEGGRGGGAPPCRCHRDRVADIFSSVLSGTEQCSSLVRHRAASDSFQENRKRPCSSLHEVESQLSMQ